MAICHSPKVVDEVLGSDRRRRSLLQREAETGGDGRAGHVKFRWEGIGDQPQGMYK